MHYISSASTIALLYFSAFFSYAANIDSLGIEKENGEVYILHQVESQETLYALSRRYGTSVDTIVGNNLITGNSLVVGSVLRIPWQYGITHVITAGETLYSLSKLYKVSVEHIKSVNDLASNELEVGMNLNILSGKQAVNGITSELSPTSHIVGFNETLYSISKKYLVNLEDLKNWNNLESNNVRVGDTLTIEDIRDDRLISTNPPAETQQTVVDDPRILVTNPETSSSEKLASKSKEAAPVKENGMAAVIDGNSDTKKYLALHRTAPIGTIMRVRNEMTNLSVFVRVVGKLPNTGANNNVLLRLSQAAQEALGALDGKFRVEVSYVSYQ